jgi:hypothetical protein
MSVALNRRLAVLETRLAGSAQSMLGPGPLAWPDGTVFACWSNEQPRLNGMADFATMSVWNNRATCQSVKCCDHAATCQANGQHPGLAKIE